MPLKRLHELLDPPIRQLFDNNDESAVQQMLYRTTLPLLDEYESYLPDHLTAAFREKRWEGLSAACEEARDDLDNRAADAEEDGASPEELDAYSCAGIVLEMMGYLDSAPVTHDTVFNYVYCLGVFQSDESVMNFLAGPDH